MRANSNVPSTHTLHEVTSDAAITNVHLSNSTSASDNLTDAQLISALQTPPEERSEAALSLIQKTTRNYRFFAELNDADLHREVSAKLTSRSCLAPRRTLVIT